MQDWILTAIAVIAFCVLTWKLLEVLVLIARRPDLEEVRKEIRTEISNMRAELRAEMEALAREMKVAMSGMRDEIRKDMEAARDFLD